MKRKGRILVFSLVLAACLLASTPALAWNGNQNGTGTHASIANQSVVMLQNDLAATSPQKVRDNLAIVGQYLNQLKTGSCFPDYDPNMYQLYQDHFWDPDTGHNFTYSASWYVAGKIDSTANTNVVKFTALAMNDWKKGNYSNAVFELGEAMHFVGDLNCPYHAANITAVDSLGHVQYESFADNGALKYLLATAGAKSTDSFYSSAINATPLEAWITGVNTSYAKIAKNLYYTKATTSNSTADWDASLGVVIPDAQKNAALLLYRFLNEVSGTVSSSVTTFSSFQLVVKTADVTYAGTDDNIYYGFQTSDGRKFEFLLDNPGNDLERNQIDTYVITLPSTVDAKNITKTWLRKSNYLFGDDWMPATVQVIINGSVKQDDTLNRWFKGNTTYALPAGLS